MRKMRKMVFLVMTAMMLMTICGCGRGVRIIVAPPATDTQVGGIEEEPVRVIMRRSSFAAGAELVVPTPVGDCATESSVDDSAARLEGHGEPEKPTEVETEEEFDLRLVAGVERVF